MNYEKNTSFITKDLKKQIVYCVVLEPETVDLQGDVISAEEIEKAAHEYMEKHRLIGDAHQEIGVQAVPVESFIAPVDMAVGDGEAIKKGSWVMAIKVNDPELWGAVESGEYTGFSIGGTGIREDMV